MKSVRNSARPDRLGTDKPRQGRNNKLVVPARADRIFHEEIAPCVKIVRTIGVQEVTFLVQRTRSGWFYPCTVDDICAMLHHLPSEDVGKIRFIVLRQPTHKQRILSPAWGRAVFLYAPNFKVNQGGKEGYSGPAVVLEAQSLQPFKWEKAMTPDRKREFERLQQDGHCVTGTHHRFFILQPDAVSLRHTLLYRTLLHEVGHLVDFCSYDETAWKTRPWLQREDFAHRYAEDAYAALKKAGAVPFSSLFDVDAIIREGLSPDDFLLARRD
ncbi:MAG: hypothetical protein LBE15_05580 [Burkholderiales bacterium]|jgi:hypothetical protein|nr:hypothetical protein [Burkholderiales bacterium]